MSESIDYGNLMHDAMRGLIRKVLDEVKLHGLPGDHHFFINFDTRAEGVELADWMRDRFPEDMTIVLQHWFANLDVTEDGFSVTLNFGDTPEPLYIPFDAINTFVDPSVEFGLRFETQDTADEDEHVSLHLATDEDSDGSRAEDQDRVSDPEHDRAPKGEKPKTKSRDAEVVSLDSFRK